MANDDESWATKGEDGAVAVVWGVSEQGAGVPQPANGAPEGVERAEVKRAKLDEAASGESLMDVEEKKIVESESVDTVVAKYDSGAEDAVAETEKGTNMPGGGKEGKKRKVAMLLAYCGAGYQGMQRNPGAITIEGELEQALFRANAIAQCNFGDMRKVD